MSLLEFIGALWLIYFLCKLVIRSSICIYYYCIKSAVRRDILRKHKGRWAGKWVLGDINSPVINSFIELLTQWAVDLIRVCESGQLYPHLVVTGATDGIGKSYANALGALGLNIVLISRDIKKLNDCAGEIEAKHNVQTKVIPIDFTKGIDIYEEIDRVLSELEIGVLVNNVGISYTYPEVFVDIPDRKKFLISIIRANVISVTKMCEIVMPKMVERKSGVIINISSASALIPSPMLTVYAATKAYVEKFSDDLRHEYQKQGLTIQTVLPGYVATKMSKIKKSSWLAPTADRFVKSALQKVGVFHHTTGYFPHTLFVNALNSVGAVCHPLLVRLVLRSMRNIRARALSSLKKKVTEQ